jgi:hypothetical protein
MVGDVSEYTLFHTLPSEYENILPTAEDIEKRIGDITDDDTMSANVNDDN